MVTTLQLRIPLVSPCRPPCMVTTLCIVPVAATFQLHIALVLLSSFHSNHTLRAVLMAATLRLRTITMTQNTRNGCLTAVSVKQDLLQCCIACSHDWSARSVPRQGPIHAAAFIIVITYGLQYYAMRLGSARSKKLCLHT